MSFSRMMPCPGCCPARDGRRAGSVRHELTDVERGGRTVRAWRCWNCGRVKEPRVSRKRLDWDWITKEAETDEGMAIADRVRFHCFNPHGLYAQLKDVQALVADVVDGTGVPNGVLMVHGSLNDYDRKRLFGLLDQKRRVDRVLAGVVFNMIRDEIREGSAWAERAARKWGAVQ